MEQNFNEFEHNHEHEHGHCHCKEGCFKYALIFFATILGAFLAFYFVADYTLKMMFSPEHQMRRVEKMMRQMDRQMSKDFNKDFNKEIMVIGKTMQNPVGISENDDSYIVTVALKPFGNSAKNIKVDVEDDNVLKIEGSNEIKKGSHENMINLMQAYKLQKKVDKDKMTTKEEHGKYVVTIPFSAQ